jgi:hypothetical protein
MSAKPEPSTQILRSEDGLCRELVSPRPQIRAAAEAILRLRIARVQRIEAES